ncbi:hypothetical protein [Gelidibacter salicanalis]|uniref:Porin n=1 Tax=Gelidibacter salicanalis TaxID=291193 RepID=A0A934NK83_9FLAO|nr:hypothetical protein [Gelidibacter salicanalis]MBJ7882899.1 hypothetical protein [Gelidibacter salicanalis]
MRTLIKNSAIAFLLLAGITTYAQKNDRSLDNYREPDKNGINVFESPKDTVSTFENVKVRIGGSSTIQFQALEHSNLNPSVTVDGVTTNPYQLKEIGSNFNLATANLDLDVALYDGVRMHLRTYLSSRHHPEPYVKGGYFQIDKLEFIKEGFLEDFMKYATIKIGHMENNYGDAHFRRSDNAQAIYNPFVGNLIMDAFTTEVGAELLIRKNGFIGMIGMANGKLNQSINKSANGTTGGASLLAKIGYDKQIDTDLRFRLTGSIYNTGYVPSSYLYNADRAGSRYYGVMIPATASGDNFRSGRYDPGFKNQITAVMINPFIKYKGLEFFGTIERTSGKSNAELEDRKANQFSGELIYRFGNNENFYIGSRYNTVDSEDASGDDVEISRFQIAGGWFMTKNILMKVEYVNQKYDGYKATSSFADGKFNGLMAEAVISF